MAEKPRRKPCYPFSADHISKHNQKMVLRRYRVKDIEEHFMSIRDNTMKRKSKKGGNTEKKRELEIPRPSSPHDDIVCFSVDSLDVMSDSQEEE